MCTVSWLTHDCGYELFFNRDESRTRVRAEPPRERELQNVKTLMPTDPEGGGTWIAVNQFGLCFALLNLYQGGYEPAVVRSRGRLIPALASALNLEDAICRFRSLELNSYRSFTVLILDADGNTWCANWYGELRVESAKSPLVSSSVEFESVRDARLKSYESRVLNPAEAGLLSNEQRLFRFHCGHQPAASARSVCMHRSDAKTQSLTQVSVNVHECTMRYFDGSPCEAGETVTTKLRRIAFDSSVPCCSAVRSHM